MEHTEPPRGLQRLRWAQHEVEKEQTLSMLAHFQEYCFVSRGVDLKMGQEGTLESCDQTCPEEVITQTEQAG